MCLYTPQMIIEGFYAIQKNVLEVYIVITRRFTVSQQGLLKLVLNNNFYRGDEEI